MTIGIYIVRFIVACGFAFSFILTLFLYSKATVRLRPRFDVLTCMSTFVLFVFVWLLWIMK